MKKLILIGLLTILLITSLASATDYYISNSTGSDSATGSQAAPWASVSKIMTLTNISAGDNFYFKRGDTWREWFNYTGTAGSSDANRVSFKAYGTGAKPKMYGSLNYSLLTWTNTSTLWTTGNQLLNNTVNMIWCNGTRGQNKSNAALLSSTCDFYYNSTSKNITVYYAGDLAGSGIEIGQIDIPGLTDFWRDQVKAYLTFENLEFGYCNNKCFYNQLSTGVRFINLTINHVWNNGLYINGDSTNPLSIHSVVVENNTFYDTGLRGNILGGGGESVWVAAMRNTSIRNNTFLNPHGVVINFFKAMEGLVANNSIRDCEQDQSDFNSGIYYDASNHTISEWNLVKNCTVGMSINAETANTLASNNTFRRNVLVNNNVSIVINSNQNNITVHHTNISHNTIVKQNNATGGYKYLMMMKFFNNLSFTDNVVQGIGDSVGQIIQLTNHTGVFYPDYNMYNQTAQSIVFEVNGTNKTIAEWQAYGYDANSVFNSPPKFVGFDAEVYTQYNDSDACDAGSLGSDIGAYDCVAGSSVGLAAPSSAQLLASNTTWLYFNWTVNNGTYYNRTTLLISSVEVANYTAAQTTHNATGLINGTGYLITLRNYDNYGNWNETNTTLGTLNLTWVNGTNALAYIIAQNVSYNANTTNTNAYHWQTFTTNTTTLTNISVILYKTGGTSTDPNSINLSLRNSTNHTLITVPATQVLNSTYFNEVFFDFPAEETVVSGQTHYIYLTSNDLGLVVNRQGNIYAEGQYHEGIAYDMLFRTWYSTGEETGAIVFYGNTPDNASNLINSYTYEIQANSSILGDWAITNLTIYNSTNSIIYTIQQNTTLINQTFQINVSDTYRYNVTAYDEFQYALSENREFTIFDADIEIIRPDNLSKINNTATIEWNLSTTQLALNISYIQWYIDANLITNITSNFTRVYNQTDIFNWSLLYGLHNLSFNATLTNGNQIRKEILINITRNTNLSIIWNNAITGLSAPNINYTITDSEITDEVTGVTSTGNLSIEWVAGNTTIVSRSSSYLDNTTGHNVSIKNQNITINLYPSGHIITFNQSTDAEVQDGTNLTTHTGVTSIQINTSLWTLNNYIYVTYGYGQTYVFKNTEDTLENVTLFLINLSYTKVAYVEARGVGVGNVVVKQYQAGTSDTYQLINAYLTNGLGEFGAKYNDNELYKFVTNKEGYADVTKLLVFDSLSNERKVIEILPNGTESPIESVTSTCSQVENTARNCQIMHDTTETGVFFYLNLTCENGTLYSTYYIADGSHRAILNFSITENGCASPNLSIFKGVNGTNISVETATIPFRYVPYFLNTTGGTNGTITPDLYITDVSAESVSDQKIAYVLLSLALLLVLISIATVAKQYLPEGLLISATLLSLLFTRYSPIWYFPFVICAVIVVIATIRKIM